MASAGYSGFHAGGPDQRAVCEYPLRLLAIVPGEYASKTLVIGEDSARCPMWSESVGEGEVCRIVYSIRASCGRRVEVARDIPRNHCRGHDARLPTLTGFWSGEDLQSGRRAPLPMTRHAVCLGRTAAR